MLLRIDVITIFPEFFEIPLKLGLLGKAINKKSLIGVFVHNLRDYAHDNHKTVDDTPYGGGPGMVMKCEPIYESVEALKGKNSLEHIILLSPAGKVLTQDKVKEMASWKDFVLICGRYEGVDERVVEGLVTEEISIGDYVLSGGELPALVVIEAVSRMVPGVVGEWESVVNESFYNGLLSCPQYTKPANFRGMKVPDVLLSGNHEEIRKWREKQAILRTLRKRPDLFENLRERLKIDLDELEDMYE
ncbi:MAG: tRNA (guanosine(37)-N1)-methyltransferase TrmD [Candidatus Hydrogenedentes bacterium]|nr:tRNA (guanosine(37)-N1)-methyltransferase TrmD [Candidatus Hydrogenedentota bacterium]